MFPLSVASRKLLTCPPQPAPPNFAAFNVRGPRANATAKSSAASANQAATSAFAPTASCTVNLAAPPAITKHRIRRQPPARRTSLTGMDNSRRKPQLPERELPQQGLPERDPELKGDNQSQLDELGDDITVVRPDTAGSS